MKKRDKAILKGVFLIVLFYVLAEHYAVVTRLFRSGYNLISPLLYGIVIAFVINLIVVRLERGMTGKIFKNQSVKRTVSIILSVLILVGIIIVVCSSVIPGITDSVKQIAVKAPDAADTVISFLKKYLGISDEVIASVRNFQLDQDILGEVFGMIDNQSIMQALKASGNMVSSIVAVFVKFFVGLFFSFYILAKKENIIAYLHRLVQTYLPEKRAEMVEYVGHVIYETYASFISGQCLDASILGCLLALCMAIMRMPYPILVGVIVAVTALIPVVGSLVGGSVGVILLVMESPIKAITFLILFFVLQQIDNRLIYPHVVGNAIGIPSILIFAAIVIGGQFGGVIGMFLGIPFTAVLYTLLDRNMEMRRRESAGKV